MNDAIAGVAWFAVNVAAVSAAWRVARRALPDDNFSQAAMHTLVILWSALVGVCLLLGGFGVLTAGAMGTLMLALSMAAHLHQARRFAAVCRYRETVLDRSSLHQEKEAQAAPRHRALCVLWAALAALAGGMVIQRLLGFPEHWDDLMYHLPFVDHWLQDHSIYKPATSEWTNACNAEMIGLWLVAPFSGDFWIGAANLPVVALLVLAVVELGRETGLTPLMRHGVAVAAIATNVVLIQLTDLENDTAAAALFVAGLAYAWRYARTGRAADMVLCACALGILPGVKYYALGYAAVAAVAVVGLAWACRGRGAAVRLAAIGLTAGMLLSGYWYARNWVVTGTPVFPLGISTETDVLRSVNPDTYTHTFFGNGRATLWLQYLGALWRLGGPCHVTAAALAPVAVLWLLAGVWLRDWRPEERCQRRARPILGAAFCASVLVFSITPYTVSDDDERKINGDFVPVRYSECPVALGLIVMGAALGDVGRALAGCSRSERTRDIFVHGPGALEAAVAVGQIVFQCQRVRLGDALLIAANIGLAAWLVRELTSMTIWNKRRELFVRAAVLVALSAGSSWWLSERWHAHFAKNFDRQFATKAFSRLESGAWPASRIGVADYRYYPFFGSRRQFRAHRPFRITTPSSLDGYLEENRIDLLAVVRKDFFRYGRYLGVAEWVKEDRMRFEKIESAATFDFYRVTAANDLGRSGRSTQVVTASDKHLWTKEGGQP